MAKIGKISSIKKEYGQEYKQSLPGSLASNGYYRFPGTGVRFVPYKEKNGKYRTGLDPDALYIQRMMKINPEEAEQERARVIALRDELELSTGLDLSPTSEYYSKMFDPKFRTTERAKVVKLVDGVNLFNLDDPYDLITYSWLKVHEDIAPSYQAWLEGRVANATNVQFYVDDIEYETEVAYKEKTLMNKAVATLDAMSPEKQFKTARLLGLPIRHDDKPSAIYNAIDSFIKSSGKSGNKLANVNLFNKIIGMTDENFNIRYTVEEALKYNIYRIKNMRVYEGETVIGKDKEEVIQNLSLPKFQEDFLSLEEKIRQRRLQEV